jgi:NAD(P)-dependent dehydrogenase (short-subunit alcohol dehydrogenase family)
MSRVLITGNETPLFSALCGEASKRVEAYAVAPILAAPGFDPLVPSHKTAEKPQDQNSQDKQILLEWNSSSPISARTIVLSAVNKMEHIDGAFLVCVPPIYRKTAEELAPAEIDRLIDSNIKSWYFLVRELATLFSSRKQGMLSLVVSEINAGQKDDVPDIFGHAAVSVFRSFAQRVVISSLTSSYNAMGFSYSEPGEESAFAAYVFKAMEEGKKNSGKWHKYGKLGLFGL